MSIVKMDRIEVIGMAEDKADVIETLMKMGVVEIDGPVPADPAGINQPGRSEQPSHHNSFESLAEKGDDWLNDPLAEESALTLNALTRLESAIQICNNIRAGRKEKAQPHSELSIEDLLKTGLREKDILVSLNDLEKIQLRQTALKTDMTRDENTRDLLLPWAGLEIDLADMGTTHTRLFVGSLPRQEQVDQFLAILQDEAPETHVHILRQDELGVLCSILTWKPREGLVQGHLRRLGFHDLPLQGRQGTPSQILQEINRRLEQSAQELADQEQSMLSLIARQDDFERLHDFYQIRSIRLQTMSDLGETRSTFHFTGWLPAKIATAVKKKLSSQYMLAIEHRPAQAAENPPVLLHNNPFVRSYEVIVEMFSPPSQADLDPSPIMAPFFFIFYGMMLSDVGYGALLTGLCLLLIYKVKSTGELGRMAHMLMYSGIASIIWGFLFGGFFGNMLSVLSADKINMPALWFDPMDDPIGLMIWCMVFGVLHLFTGMIAHIYMLACTGHLLDGLLDIAPWFLIISGLGLMIGGIGGQAGLYVALAGAAVILLFGGRAAKNPLLRLVKGLGALYGVTGYLSDILSYTRILALVLATSVIAMVVNLLGFLLGPTPAGIFMFIIVAVLGHSLNLALSALSAYVHTSRLQYVEFFSKFYEGGGRLWSPLRLRTRYTRIRAVKDPEHVIR